MQFGVCCLLVQGVFAENEGGRAGGGGHAGVVTAGHNSGHIHGSIRTFGRARSFGYGYGGFYGDYSEPFYDSGDAPRATPPSSVMVVVPPAPAAVETVHPVIHEYNQPQDYGTAAAADGQPVLYLIAFRDDTIRAAMTYWVQDGTLHYLDTNHMEKEAPVSSINRDLSARLNRERHVPFDVQ